MLLHKGSSGVMSSSITPLLHTARTNLSSQKHVQKYFLCCTLMYGKSPLGFISKVFCVCKYAIYCYTNIIYFSRFFSCSAQEEETFVVPS